VPGRAASTAIVKLERSEATTLAGPSASAVAVGGPIVNAVLEAGPLAVAAEGHEAVAQRVEAPEEAVVVAQGAAVVVVVTVKAQPTLSAVIHEKRRFKFPCEESLNLHFCFVRYQTPIPFHHSHTPLCDGAQTVNRLSCKVTP
jgi:hypothetical protein